MRNGRGELLLLPSTGGGEALTWDPSALKLCEVSEI